MANNTITTIPDGVPLPVDALAKTYGTTTLSDSTVVINTITVVYNNKTYIKTLTYSNSTDLITAESGWVLS